MNNLYNTEYVYQSCIIYRKIGWKLPEEDMIKHNPVDLSA